MQFPSDEHVRPRRAPLVLGLVFVALSLASIHHADEGWQGAEQRFDIDADRWELGAPLPWLSWCKVTITGDAPPIETVPEGRDYLPGLHWNAVLMGLALACAVGLVWIPSVLWRRFGPVLARRDSLPSPRLLAVSFGSGVVLGLLAGIRHPDWLRPVCMLIPLPAVVIAVCWRRPSAVLAAVYLASGILGLTLVELFDDGRPLIDRAVDLKRDFLPQLALLVVNVLLVSAALALLRRARRRLEAPQL